MNTPRTVKRFKAPGPWITRELRDCVQASDYDALASDLAAAREELNAAKLDLAFAKSGFDSAEKLRRQAQEELARVKTKHQIEITLVAGYRDAERQRAEQAEAERGAVITLLREIDEGVGQTELMLATKPGMPLLTTRIDAVLDAARKP